MAKGQTVKDWGNQEFWSGRRELSHSRPAGRQGSFHYENLAAINSITPAPNPETYQKLTFYLTALIPYRAKREQMCDYYKGYRIDGGGLGWSFCPRWKPTLRLPLWTLNEGTFDREIGPCRI